MIQKIRNKIRNNDASKISKSGMANPKLISYSLEMSHSQRSSLRQERAFRNCKPPQGWAVSILSIGQVNRKDYQNFTLVLRENVKLTQNPWSKKMWVNNVTACVCWSRMWRLRQIPICSQVPEDFTVRAGMSRLGCTKGPADAGLKGAREGSRRDAQKGVVEEEVDVTVWCWRWRERRRWKWRWRRTMLVNIEDEGGGEERREGRGKTR